MTKFLQQAYDARCNEPYGYGNGRADEKSSDVQA